MNLLLQIRKKLTDDLLLPKYRRRKRLTNTAGHCYVASETLYHLLSNRQRKKYKPYYLKLNGITHWFLMTDDKINILDPTYDQFLQLPNYGNGKRAAFLTKKPSKRSKILIDRIKKK